MINLEKIENIKKDKKVGFTISTFDVLHPGNIKMLAESKSNCDFLIVGLLDDPTKDREHKNKPILSIFERWCILSSVSYVDLIIPFDYEKDIVNFLYLIKPHIRFVGEEYKDVNFTGLDACKELGIKIFFNERKHNYSSTNLRKLLKNY